MNAEERAKWFCRNVLDWTGYEKDTTWRRIKNLLAEHEAEFKQSIRQRTAEECAEKIERTYTGIIGHDCAELCREIGRKGGGDDQG